MSDTTPGNATFPSPDFLGPGQTGPMGDGAPSEDQLRSLMNIFLVANRLQAIMDKQLAEITAKQWIALIMLSTFPEPPLLKHLAERCGITHQSAMQLVKKLQDKGYVETATDPRDRRALRITATPKAQRWGLSYAAAHKESLDELFAVLTDEEMTLFAAAQQKLYHRLSEWPESGGSADAPQ